MLKDLIPKPRDLISSLVGNVLWTVLVTSLTAFSLWRREMLTTEARSGLHLDSVSAFFVGVPTWLFIAGLVLIYLAVDAVLIGVLIRRHARSAEHNEVFDSEAYAWRVIAPIVNAYISARSLAERLRAFSDGMERFEDMDADARSMAKWGREVAAKNSAAFNADYRKDLVKLVTDVRTEFGMVSPLLTDEKMAAEIYGPNGLQPMIQGLQQLVDQLGASLVVRATEAGSP